MTDHTVLPTPSHSAANSGALQLVEAVVLTDSRLAAARNAVRDYRARIKTLDEQHCDLSLDTSELNTKLVAMLALAVLATGADVYTLSAFAQAFGELTSSGNPDTMLLAAIFSLALVACDIGAGLMFSKRTVGGLRSLLRAVLVGGILAVPTTITIGTAMARWSINGTLPPEFAVITVASAAFTLAVHATLLGLAGSGAARWTISRLQRFGLSFREGRELSLVRELEQRLVTDIVRFEVGVPAELKEPLRQRIPVLGDASAEPARTIKTEV